MSNSMSEQELNELVLAHLSGTPTASQVARLEVLLESDREHLHRYIENVRESAALHDSLRSSVVTPGARLDGTKEVLRDATTTLKVSRRSPCDGTTRDLFWRLGIVAAACCIVGVSAWQLWMNEFGPADGVGSPLTSTSHTPASGEPVLARIVRKVACVWEDEKWTVGSTVALTKGQMLRISEGLMEIEFECGARVALQGPARFKITGPKAGVLYAGQLTAIVPESAHGFSVEAPTTNVVDLGTSFSLNVRNNGSTEVYVIDGAVTYQPLKLEGNDPANEATLHKSDAVLVAVDGTQPIPFENAPRLLREDTIPASAPSAWPEPAERSLALWLDASWDVEADLQSGVRRWGDRLYGGNTRSEMAWQMREKNRPRWVQRAIGGKPAIAFDGTSSFLVTDALATTDEQTVMIVVAAKPWTVPSKLRFPSRQVLNYNGPPNLVMQVVEDEKFVCWNHSSSYSSPHDRIGQLTTRQLEPEQPLLICYRYSLDGQSTDLQVNGKHQCRTNVTIPAAIDSPKYIGCHWSESQHFEGLLAELLIFNESLADDDMRVIAAYLAEKYALRLEGVEEPK